MTFATRELLLAVVDVSEYEQVVDISKELQRAESKILRLLSESWFRKFLSQHPEYTPGPLQAALLDPEQLGLPTVYYALAYLIYPKITQTLGLNTNNLQAEYHNRWEEAFRNLLEFGITYDSQGTTLRTMVEIPTDYIRVRT